MFFFCCCCQKIDASSARSLHFSAGATTKKMSYRDAAGRRAAIESVCVCVYSFRNYPLALGGQHI